MEENMSSTQEKPRDRVMALPEKLRKELLYLAHLDPERQKSTLLHNVAVSGEKIQQLIDSAKREGAIEELKRTAVNPYYPGGPSKEDAVVYVKQIRNRIQQLTGGK